MVNDIKGKVAYVFGDNINTDTIQPPRYFSLDREKNKEGLFKGVTDPNFPVINEGDLIVGGKNFGCGSSRETVVYAIKDTKIPAIIAESFGRIFYRNCINNAIPVLQIEDTSEINPGDELYIDMQNNVILNSEKRIPFSFPNKIREIIDLGGLIKKLEDEL